MGHNIFASSSSSVRAGSPHVFAVETGNGTPGLSMLSDIGPLPDFDCPGAVDPDVFFPKNFSNDYALARAFCDNCPVIEKCRAFADATEPTALQSLSGMIGGELPSERWKRRQGVRLEKVPDKTVCVTCGRKIRPQHQTLVDYPGTVVAGTRGRCGACTTRADGVSTARKNWRSTCQECGRQMRQTNVLLKDAPGTVMASSKTQCQSCRQRGKRRAE